MRWLRRIPPAIPPRNVRFVHPDGQVVPVECVYQGWDRVDGVHSWVAVAPVQIVSGTHLCCDSLPPRTGVTVAVFRGEVDSQHDA